MSACYGLRRHRLPCVGGFLLAAAVSGCANPGGIEVVTAYGKGIKFDGIGSRYAWAPSQHESNGGGAARIEKVIEPMAEQRLAAAGFSPAQGAAPDFWVRMQIARNTRTDASVSPFGVTVHDGELILSVLNPKDGKVIWWGVARAEIDPSMSPAQRETTAGQALDLLMKQFPKK